MEGELRAKDSIKLYIMPNHKWIVPLDNDFLSSPYRDGILDELRESMKWIDFNQGLDASKIDFATSKELATLDLRDFASGDRLVRIAHDFLEQGEDVRRAVDNLKSAGFNDIPVYNPYNYREITDEILPSSQRYTSVRS